MKKTSKLACFQVEIVLFLLTAVFPLHAADPEFPSVWRATEIVVDGSADDWAGTLVPIPDTPIVLGIQNDRTFLYLCLRTSDEAAKKRIQALGVNFYLDASGKADRAFGVRYPAPAKPPAPRPADAPSEDGQPVRVRRQASSDEIQVLGRDAEGGGKMTVAQVKPLAAAMAEKDGALVLELKIPLAFSLETPFAIQTAVGRTIALGLEGAQPDRELRSGGKRGGRGGEGTEGGGTGGRGGAGLGGGGFRGGMGESAGGGRGGSGGASARGARRATGRPSARSGPRSRSGSRFRSLPHPCHRYRLWPRSARRRDRPSPRLRERTRRGPTCSASEAFLRHIEFANVCDALPERGPRRPQKGGGDR